MNADNDVVIIEKEEQTMPSNCESSAFLARYATELLGSGATCIRLERNLSRIAAKMGKEVSVVIFPRHIHMTVYDLRDRNIAESITTITPVNHNHISYNVNTQLSRLSWDIADGKIWGAEAEKRFDEIIGSKEIPNSMVTLLVMLANASFCRLFGGDLIAMTIVALATLVGYMLKLTLLRLHVDLRITVFFCAFVSALIGGSDYCFNFGLTPGVAIGTSVLYLVPGIPFLNSFSDMLNHHYICAFSRFLDAVILTFSLSLGICAAMWLLHLNMF